MIPPEHDSIGDGIKERLERLEERVRRIEEARGMLSQASETGDSAVQFDEPEEIVGSGKTVREAQDQLEFEVGTVWFSRVGIIVLALGVAFGLSLPYPGISSYVPSLGGLLLVAIIFLAAHRWRGAMGPLAGFIRGGGVILLYFATLRLFFFGKEAALNADSWVGITVLVAATATCFLLATRCRSACLTGIALVAGYATALIVPVPWFSLCAVLMLVVVAAWICGRSAWPWVLSAAVVLGYTTFLLVMLNRPVLGNPVRWIIEPAMSPAFVLIYTVILALGSLFRRGAAGEDPPTVINAFLNCGLGFLAFFLSIEAGARSDPGPGHAWVAYAVAALVFLAIATAFWTRERSRLSTFVYSMTGYMALSVGIAKFSEVPNVFVWLSMQSLVVVATAIWFQSRFIVSANFLIYLMTIAGYLAVAEAGSGISFVFGAVALGSARILAWQKDRLQLKTEFMRNGYLACGFVAFPYALYHLVPRNYVSISWVGIALFYYLMNLVVDSRKYRWMGHATLLGTVLYLIVVGIIQLKPAHRILSFVVLGIVLVGVSLVFSILRSRRRGVDQSAGQETDGN